MRAARRFTALGLLAIGAGAVIAAARSSPQSSQASPQPPAQASAQASTQQSDYALKVKTRVITVDVVATDSHGDVVRDLKPEEFEISDNGPQKIDHFAFIDRTANSAAAKPGVQPRAAGVYTNQAAFDSLAVPPTALLMDALNTPIQQQMNARKQMLNLLKTLPQYTPLAVLVLGNELSVVQDFTSDPSLLRAALNKVLSSPALVREIPGNDPDSLSEMYLDSSPTGQEDAISMSLEDFEKNQYQQTMSIRVSITSDALQQIAAYMRGYAGRKNLIWVSESFPIALLPDTNFKKNTNNLAADPFTGTDTYGEKVQQAANALSDAQVAVYPVYAGGLETVQSFNAAQRLPMRAQTGPGFTQQLNRESLNRSLSEGTMEQLAQGTGGRTCKNTNDLSGCVAGALKDSSSYYELAYYPENVQWDGSFHKISVKTTRHGVKLAYRPGYFAVDERALAKQQPPERSLQLACRDLLPSTGIPVTVQALAPDKSNAFRYLVTIPTSGLDLGSEGPGYNLSARAAGCQYATKTDTFNFMTWDLSQDVSAATYQKWQAQGYRGILDVPQASGARRVRLAVIDQKTGLIGAVDIPVRQEDIAAATAAPPAALAPGADMPVASPSGPGAVPLNGTSVGFKVDTGQTGTLDWSGDKVRYNGELAIDQTAPAFFKRAYMDKFRCDSGKLALRDLSENATPVFRLALSNSAGQTAIIDLSGTEPEYSGTLPVDETAQAFFLRLWYLCHCTSP